MTKLQQGDIIKCPHCERPLEGTVEDYVIPGRAGDASAAKEQCEDCDEWFAVRKNSDDSFNVYEI